MSSISRRVGAVLAALVVLLSPAHAQTTPRYLHPLNLALPLPAEWALSPSLEADNTGQWVYRAPDGAVMLRIAPDFGASSATQACQRLATENDLPDTAIQAASADRCVVMGEGAAFGALRLPTSQTRGGARFGVLAFSGQPDTLPEVLNGAQFPESVSTPLYLSGALDLLQAEYLYSQRVDWARLKAASLSDLPDDASLDLAYERLEAALRAIGVQGRDGHSQLFRPNRVGRVMPLVGSGARYTRDGLVILVYPGSAAERGGVQVGDRIESIDGIGLYTLQSRIDNGLDSGAALPYAVTLWRDGRQQTVFVDFGGYTDLLPPVIQRFGSMVYIETFGTYGTGIDTPQYLDYLTDAHDRLSAAANAGATCGYVLDVRRNLGGVAFPVLLPMMPLVGSGLFGTAYRPEGQAVFFGRYDAETARITGGAITGNGRLLPRTPAVLDTSLPVAVLTSSATASMGEYSAVMLLGNPDRSVRIFGERTAGLASFLGFYTLADGGALWIARTLLTDRIGRSYLDGLTPDQPLAVDWARYATPTDPVLVAALGWLRAQGC